MRVTVEMSEEGFNLLRRPEGCPVERVKLVQLEGVGGVYKLAALIRKDIPEYEEHPNLRVDDRSDWGGTRT